ncbi:MAG TPA: OB-fold nucleic acid binding domain-containing protein, partial [bacterium]|nr:OB-fold nucleic acid binding domain-containing protein [bacterium]
MRSRIYIEDIFKGNFLDGEEVTVKGWLYNKRSSGKLNFLLVRDGTNTIQATVYK